MEAQAQAQAQAQAHAKDPPSIPEVRLADGIFRPSAALSLGQPAVAAARAGLRPPHVGLALRDASALLDPGYLEMENGYCRLPDGILHVAVHTPMPGVSGEMIDWWFAWHGEDSARYQLWHPRDHVSARWRRPFTWAGGDRMQWQQLYRGNVSEVVEYVGSTRMRLAIEFADPADYLDTARFDAGATETVVCGRTHSRAQRAAAGHLLHQVRRIEGGVEMRSRFWLGDIDPHDAPVRLLRPLLNARFARRRLMPEQLGRDLLVHCAEEMTHLAELLPELFRRVVRPAC